MSVERIDFKDRAGAFAVAGYEVRAAHRTEVDGALDFGTVEFSTAEFGLAPTVSLYYSGHSRERGWTINLSTGTNVDEARLGRFTAQLEGARQLMAELNSETGWLVEWDGGWKTFDAEESAIAYVDERVATGDWAEEEFLVRPNRPE